MEASAQRRALSPRTSRARTPASTLATRLRQIGAQARAGTYPLTQYATDPVRYAHERLRIPMLMPHQEAILRAVALGVSGGARPRAAVRSGQKCGKTLLAVVAVFWFYECFEGARVFLCAAIESQTKLVLWREVGQVLRNARAAGVEIDGKISASPAGGIVSTDGSREIRGISGREIESIAGLSGRQLTVIDEASHLPESKAQVFAGNALGGGSLLLISNPTRNQGPFFEAFHLQKEFWETFHIDGEELAKWQEETGRKIPHTVNRARVEEMREMYGEDSPFWFLRVKGDFLRNETGRAIQLHTIESALARWATAADDGELAIGYDPAGPGDAGDEHAWAVVRGAKCLAVLRRRALGEEAALEETYALLRVHRKDGETPRVSIDAEGPIGSAIYGRLRAEGERRRLHDARNAFEVVGVRSSSKFVRDPTKFERTRDELVWNLAEWMATGSIPDDDKLQTELHAPVWTSRPSGQIASTPKSTLRDLLNRSPDTFDALALGVWQPRTWTSPRGEGGGPGPGAPYTRGRDQGGGGSPRYLGELYGVQRPPR